MRILILAPVHFEKDFLEQKGKSPFLSIQAQAAWYDAIRDLGHDVSVFRYSDTYLVPNNLRIYISDIFQKVLPRWRTRFVRYVDKLRLSYPEEIVRTRELKKMVDRFHPDLIIVSGGFNGIAPNAISDLKNKHNVKFIFFSGINPVYGASKLDREVVSRNIFDFIYVNDAGYAKNWGKMGAARVVVLPVSAANPKIHKRYKLTREELKEYGCDVCFIGSLSAYRQDILEKLTDFNLKIWGVLPPGVALSKKLMRYYRGEAFGAKMAKIYNASKIVINIHERDMRFGGNLKTFEIPSTGALQLVDTVDSSWFKIGEEVIVYQNTKDLKDKIEYFLKHPEKRQRVAAEGYKRVQKDHYYKNRFKKIFSMLNIK